MRFEMKNKEKSEDEMDKIIEMVEKYQIAAFQEGRERRIRVDSSIARTPADVEYVKSHKQEIIRYLDNESDRRLAEEKAKNHKKYAFLIKKLPVRNITNTPDEKRFSEIMSQINYHHFTGREDDGLNLSISAGNSRIRQEASQFCSHELKTEYDYQYTQDARMRVVRTISCPKCQLYIRDEVSEEIDIEKMWN